MESHKIDVPNHQPDNSWTIVGLIVGIMVILLDYGYYGWLLYILS